MNDTNKGEEVGCSYRLVLRELWLFLNSDQSQDCGFEGCPGSTGKHLAPELSNCCWNLLSDYLNLWVPSLGLF